jgi:hypothetical protein
VARSERRGEYPGGRERRWDRYVLIGGAASSWAVRHCWREGERKEALRLLYETAPMVLAAVTQRSLRAFSKVSALVLGF